MTNKTFEEQIKEMAELLDISEKQVLNMLYGMECKEIIKDKEGI